MGHLLLVGGITICENNINTGVSVSLFLELFLYHLLLESKSVKRHGPLIPADLLSDISFQFIILCSQLMADLTDLGSGKGSLLIF